MSGVQKCSKSSVTGLCGKPIITNLENNDDVVRELEPNEILDDLLLI
jgi:hypothetical protein